MAGTVRKIGFKDARFVAFHGFYPEEQVVGTEFFADLEVAMEATAPVADQITRTISYEDLYQLVAAQMSIPQKLLETVAEQVVEKIKQSYPFITGISFTLKKTQPPLPGQVSCAVVSLIYTA